MGISQCAPVRFTIVSCMVFLCISVSFGIPSEPIDGFAQNGFITSSHQQQQQLLHVSVPDPIYTPVNEPTSVPTGKTASKGQSGSASHQQQNPGGNSNAAAGSVVVPLVAKHIKNPRSGGGVNVQKAPPDLQFGLAFTVPFVSLSTEKLLNSVGGGNGIKKRGYADPIPDVSSLFKLNVGGLVIAAVVGIAALLFIPHILPGKIPPLFPPGFLPGILDTMVPGLNLNKPFAYGQYDHHNDYGYDNGYGGIHRKDTDGRARSAENAGASANATGNSTVWTELFSAVRNSVVDYTSEAESCALHAMCIRGRNEARTKSPDRGRRSEEHRELSTFDHVLEAVEGMKDYTSNIPVFQGLHKAYRDGHSGVHCSDTYKKCDFDPQIVSKTMSVLGNYVFNSR